LRAEVSARDNPWEFYCPIHRITAIASHYEDLPGFELAGC